MGEPMFGLSMLNHCRGEALSAHLIVSVKESCMSTLEVSMGHEPKQIHP